jgi:hypothetical protein
LNEGRSKKQEARRKKRGLYIWILIPTQNSPLLEQERKLLPSSFFLLPSSFINKIFSKEIFLCPLLKKKCPFLPVMKEIG